MKQLIALTLLSGLLSVALYACDSPVIDSYRMEVTVADFNEDSGRAIVMREDGHVFIHDMMNTRTPQIGDVFLCEYDTCGTEEVDDDILAGSVYVA